MLLEQSICVHFGAKSRLVEASTGGHLSQTLSIISRVYRFRAVRLPSGWAEVAGWQGSMFNKCLARRKLGLPPINGSCMHIKNIIHHFSHDEGREGSINYIPLDRKKNEAKRGYYKDFFIYTPPSNL